MNENVLWNIMKQRGIATRFDCESSEWRIGKISDSGDRVSEVISDIKHNLIAFEDEIKAASAYDQAVLAQQVEDMRSCEIYCEQLEIMSQRIWKRIDVQLVVIDEGKNATI